MIRARCLKTILITLCCFCVPVAQAIETGFYGGVDVGFVKTDFQKDDFLRMLIDRDIVVDFPQFNDAFITFFGTPILTVAPPATPSTFEGTTIFKLLKKPDNDNYGIRLYVGYKWKNLLGVELAGFLNSDVTLKSVTTPSPAQLASVGLPTDSGLCASPSSPCFDFSADAQTRGVEVLAKVSLPMDPFSAYFKAGVAYTILDVEGKLRLTNLPGVNLVEAKVKNDVQDIRPVYVAGLAYRASKELIVDLAYHKYEASGYQPKMEMFLFSITVEFSGSDPCGDVLC